MPEPNFPYAPHLIRCNLYGARPLHDRRIRGPVLDAFASRKEWMPQAQTINDEPYEPFDRDEALKIASGRKPNDGLLFLKRAKSLAYEAMCRNDETPQVSVNCRPGKMKTGDLQSLIDLGDALAEAYRPDIGWTQIVAASGSSNPFPAEGSDKRIQLLMDEGSRPDRDGGAGGLALRTYFGPYTLSQITEKRVFSLPAPCLVRMTNWGGAIVDLVQEPWTADAGTLRKSWLAAMKHLEPAEFFATPEVIDTGYGPAVRWYRTKGDPGGRLRVM